MEEAWLRRWNNADLNLRRLLETRREQRIAGYLAAPDDVREHVSIEARMREGAYRDRPLLELIQNATDAINDGGDTGRIEVVLTDSDLYVANTGRLLDCRGLKGLLQSHVSWKRDAQIGRFGLGFKSVLSLSHQPRLLSRSLCISFSESDTLRTMREQDVLVPAEGVPVLRMGWQLTPSEAFGSDEALLRLAAWADTVVHLPLTDEAAAERVGAALQGFPAAFLLFCGGELALHLEDARAAGGSIRKIRYQLEGTTALLKEGGETESWRVFSKPAAPRGDAVLRDAGDLFGRDALPLIWAVPLTRGRPAAGRFWAFFPLAERARVPGILNAPWKTSDDRASMLAGAYNDWLIERFAELVAENISEFADPTDPGLVMEYLPRREAGGDFAAPLASHVWQLCEKTAIVPDGTAMLRPATDVAVHPVDDVDIVKQWLALASGSDRCRVLHPTVRSHRDRVGRWRRLRHGTWEAGDVEDDALRLDLREWIEMAAATDPSGCVAVINMVGAIAALGRKLCPDEVESSIRHARVILTSDEKLVAIDPPESGGLYLPGEDPSSDSVERPAVSNKRQGRGWRPAAASETRQRTGSES